MDGERGMEDGDVGGMSRRERDRDGRKKKVRKKVMEKSKRLG